MSSRRWRWQQSAIALVGACALVAGLPAASGSASGASGSAAPTAGAVQSVTSMRQAAPSLADLPAAPAVKDCASLLTDDFTGVDGAPARLDSATVVSSNVPQPYCDVKGYVASAVHFEVKLPISGWTQRFLQLGCGGYCGAVGSSQPLASTFGCAPLESGEMVVAATDLGHVRSASFFADGLWALGNSAAVADFAYLGMRKTTLIAKALMKSFYHQPARYNYFVGCSDGGREGLQELQRYPGDYDGAVIGAPVIDEIATNTFYHAWNVRVNSRPDGRAILTADKIPALHQAVLDACGTLAGGQGDMLQDPRACHLDARTLICPGTDAPTCLTPRAGRRGQQAVVRPGRRARHPPVRRRHALRIRIGLDWFDGARRPERRADARDRG
jgi:hypothetical protein